MAIWQGWKKMPTGSTQAAPAASGSVNVFARGDDHVVYHNGLQGGSFPHSWSGWKALAGLTTSLGPATTVQHNNVYVFVRKDNGRIFYTRWNGNGADGWQEVPGGELTTSTPGVAPGVLVVRRSDGRIRFNTFDGAGPVLSWGAWRDVPDGNTPSAPAITKFGAGFFLVVRGTDNGIHYKSLGADRASWGGWKGVPGGGKTPDTPAMAGELLVVRGTDDKLYWNTFDGGLNWTGWKSAQGGTHSAPALTHAGAFHVLVARGTDDGVHYAFYE